MKITHLVLQEMRHRKLNALLGVIGVAIAAAVAVGVSVLLTVHDLQTTQILAQKQKEVELRIKEYDDKIRKSTKKMGFNVVILPKDQDLTDLYAKNYASKFMPEEYANKLANSKIVTVNHLLPSLEQRIQWPEQDNRTMILIGIRGQVPIKHRDPKKPIMDTVPKGEMIVGHELARTENIKLNDELILMGRKFKVTKIHGERGDKQDITAWINLETAQDMLDKKGLINSIWALDCRCAWADLGKVRKEIGAILPNTKILQDSNKSIARAEARQAAIDNATVALTTEKDARVALRFQQERFASTLTPITIIAGAIWVALVTLINVRERKQELGILRALGYRGGQIQQLFLLKAASIGLIGAIFGYTIGIGMGTTLSTGQSLSETLAAIFKFNELLTVIGVALLLAVAATWVPAQIASQQDPAAVLREE